jgi:uncharacterized protein YhjY with autotransporter beta-barrel domain
MAKLLNRRIKAALAACLSTVAISTSLSAQTVITGNNIINVAGSTQATLNGVTFINQGLQGMARLPASTVDFRGDTFGAFSSLDINLSTWRRTANGYTGTMYALPDRGPNGVGAVTFSDYAARASIFTMAFTPYTDAANLPVAASSQQQLQLTANGGLTFRDFNGQVTTGLDPGTGATAFVRQNGLILPGSTIGPAAGKISIDAEGIRFLFDGSFYVSDEYGANVYYFDKTGQMKGVIQPPAAIFPRDAAGNPSFSSLVDAATGRRVNQGLEGIAITPDQRSLVTLLQSATMQDSNSNQQTRTNTRLLIYDISTTNTPTTPVAEYVMQLPILNANGTGAPNRTAAQSEILALNGKQFLVLSRDGNGLGQANLNPVFKSVLLIDTSGATNIAGTAFETSTTPISPNGVLNSAIKPVAQVEVVNLLNATQLGKFGMNLNNIRPTNLTLGEKWEGMALAPVLDEKAPQDFFLFVGNDNDFLSQTCRVGGEDCSQAVNSDSVVQIFRLTLPTYVDPEYLRWLNATGPLSLAVTGQTGLSIASINSSNVSAQLNVQRRGGRSADRFNAWISGAYQQADADELRPQNGIGYSDKGFQGTIGGDYAFNEQVAAGIALGYGAQDGKTKFGFGVDAKGFMVGTYLRYFGGPFYAQAGYNAGKIDLKRILRPAAYGLTGIGNSKGNAQSAFFESGFSFKDGQLAFGPLASFSYDTIRTKAYTESGAVGGNLTVPAFTTKTATVATGGEATYDFGEITAFGRATYNWQVQRKTKTASLSLASAQSEMGTAIVTVPTGGDDYAGLGVGLQGAVGKVLWSVDYSAQIGAKDRRAHLGRVGLNYSF